MVKFLWKKWLKFARIVGNFNGQIILTIFYFVIVLPFGFAARLFTDPLNMKWQGRGYKSAFSPWIHPKDTIESAKKPF